MINSTKFKNSYWKNKDTKITITMKQKDYRKNLKKINTKFIYQMQKGKKVKNL